MPLPIDEFIDNNYFNSYFVEYKMPKYFKGGEPTAVFENIKAIYYTLNLADLTEAQLEEEFIKKVLENLGYSFAYQVNKKVFRKNYKPDFILFESKKTKNARYKDDKASNENILALCESKAYLVALDSKKTNEDNPHFHLIRYLKDLHLGYGFLTNGRFWRFYDVKIQNKDKIFYQIDLQCIIIENNQIEAFHYFYYIFHKNYLLQLVKPLPDTQQANFEELSKGCILQVENDLKELIYGDNSIIEKIGQNLFAEYQSQYKIREIYANSLFFAFRLLFIAYFENKFSQILLEQHKNYKYYSLRSILKKLESKLIDAEISRLMSNIYPQIPVKNGKDNQRAFVMKYLEMSYEDLQKAVVFDTAFPRLVFRDIARNTDERSLISALIPPHVAYGNTLKGFMPKKYILEEKKIKIQPFPLERQLFANAIFNSIVLDFIMRFIINIHVNKTYLTHLPIPQPNNAELLENEIYKKLIINAWKLNVVSNPALRLTLSLSLKGREIKALSSRATVVTKGWGGAIDLPKTDKQKGIFADRNRLLSRKVVWDYARGIGAFDQSYVF